MSQLTTLDRPDSYYEELSRHRNPKHDLACGCKQCYCSPTCCMICRHEFRHTSGLHRHLSQFHQGQETVTRAVIRAKVAQRELIPDGLGYLQKLFVHDARTKVNTKELSKFAVFLEDQLELKKTPRYRHLVYKSILTALKEGRQKGGHFDLHVPTVYATIIYQIWELSGVPPSAIAIGLMAYGIEHLAQELRRYPTFPEVPQSVSQTLSAPPKPSPSKGEPLKNGNYEGEKGFF